MTQADERPGEITSLARQQQLVLRHARTIKLNGGRISPVLLANAAKAIAKLNEMKAERALGED